MDTPNTTNNCVKVVFQLGEIVKTQSQRPCIVYQECTFDPPANLRFLVFKNHYCSHIKLQHLGKNEKTYKTILKRYELMKDPHYETDSQKYHCIDLTKQCIPSFDYTRVYKIRILYFQPSPNWRNFYLKHITWYTVTKNVEQIPLPSSPNYSIAANKDAQALASNVLNTAHLINRYSKVYKSYNQKTSSEYPDQSNNCDIVSITIM